MSVFDELEEIAISAKLGNRQGFSSATVRNKKPIDETCQRGHPREGNLYFYRSKRNGRRYFQCRACQSEKQRERRRNPFPTEE